ncbi:MAG: DUF4019 domain-containing protein [Gemmatimonadaceae bacterium]
MRFASTALLGFALLVGASQAQAQGSAAPAPAAANEAAIASATKASDVWLDQLDGAQYGPSWDDAGTAFKQAVARDKWITTVQKVRGQVGPLGTRKLEHSQFSTSLPNMPAGEYVMLQYRTVSGVGGFVTETCVLEHEAARGWRVVGYFVKPA